MSKGLDDQKVLWIIKIDLTDSFVRPSFGIFPDLHVFPGGHLENADVLMTSSRIDSLKMCAIRETVEETGVWPFSRKITTFKYNRDNFNDFLIANNISINTILSKNVVTWINWRTPDCKKIYPQQWDMQMFVSIVDEFDSNPNFSSEEAVEVGWFDVHEVLERSKAKEIFLAPPQWYMLKQLQKLDYSSEQFANNIRQYISSSFIQPKLVSSDDGTIWHSILPKDRFYNDATASVANLKLSDGPFRRITMKRSDGKFHSFELVEQ